MADYIGGVPMTSNAFANAWTTGLGTATYVAREPEPPIIANNQEEEPVFVTTIAELKKKVVKNEVQNVPANWLPIEKAQLKNVLACSKNPLPMLPYSVLSYRKIQLGKLKLSVPSFMLFDPFSSGTVKFMRAKNMYGSRYEQIIQTMGHELTQIFMKDISMGHYETTFKGVLPSDVRDFLKAEKDKGPHFILAEAEWQTRELASHEVDPFIVSLCNGHFHIHKMFDLTPLEKALQGEFNTTDPG